MFLPCYVCYGSLIGTHFDSKQEENNYDDSRVQNLWIPESL